MFRSARGPAFLALFVLLIGLVAMPAGVRGAAAANDDLVELYHAWREFEAPALADGVPDYSAAAMAAQRDALPEWQARLAALDSGHWPVADQVEWHVVQAEMNGLEFDHRIRQPWARNPAFYVMIYAAQSDVPAHEGPVIHTWIDLWTYEYPLAEADVAELASRIGTIPAVLDQARGNLVGNARDLWEAGIRSFAGQSRDLARLRERVGGASADLDAAIDAAIDASDRFREWVAAEAPSKTGPSGVGKDNYTWYMRNVHLVPYSWEEQLTLMRRELARAHASMRLAEHRNRRLPELERIDDEAEYERRLNGSVDEYLEFIGEEEIHYVREWMDQALREKLGGFTEAEPGQVRNFFQEVQYRDPLVMRTHMHHWLELARMREDPHPSPIRATPSLYNIFDHRSEGLATGVEEMMMHAGLFDDHPRAQELVWIMLAQRAARAISGLMLHGNEWDMQQAIDHAVKWTPRGWLVGAGDLVRGEQHLYLQQPGYGTSYISGKIQIEELLAAYAMSRGDDYTLAGFFNDFFDAGVIPISLVGWELTGDRPGFLGAADGALHTH
jgi:hypothetical protein